MQTISKRTIVLSTFTLVMLGLVLAAFTAGRSYAAPMGTRIYDSISSPMTSDSASWAFAGYATEEFGDHIKFAQAGYKLSSVDVVLSSWACQSGKYTDGTCSTTPGTGYTHRVTLNLYEVDNTDPASPEPGALIATKTATFNIPFRPSPDPSCPSYKFKDSVGNCANGYAFEIEFDLSTDSITVPDEIIYGVAYNTKNTGYNPIGTAGPYDVLNFGLNGSTPASVGTDVDPDVVYHSASWKCDSGKSNDFSRDAGGCWDGYVPAARFNTVAADVTMSIGNSLVCGGSQTVTINFGNVSGLYGYEFKVDYNDTMVSAVGAWDNSWYNTTGAFKPWDATCTAGQCKFAVAMQSGTPVNGSGDVATIALSPLAAGSFTLQIKDVVLSTIDGWSIPVTLANGGAVPVDVCGQATVSGAVSLQGRLTPMDAGTVTFHDNGGNFADSQVAFDATTGAFSATLNVMPGGSNYIMRAHHFLYLGNEKNPLALSPGNAVSGQNTRLLGGDANNSGRPGNIFSGPGVIPGVDIADLSCISTDFGGSAGNCSNADGSTDINKDTYVNVQDLSIAGGNYSKNPFLGW